MNSSTEARGAVLVTIASACFAVATVLARAATTELPESEVLVLRFAIGLAGPAGFFLWHRRGPQLREWRLLLARGILGGVSVFAWYFAISHTSATASTLLHYTYPVFASLFAALTLRERVGARLWVSLAVTMAGVWLIALGQGRGLGETGLSLGVVAGGVSGVVAGGAIAAVRALRRRGVDTGSVFLSYCLCTLAISMPVATTEWVPPSPRAWVLCVGVGVVALVAQMLLTYSLRFLSAASGSTLNQLTPVFTYALAAATIGERLSALANVGAVLVLGGVLWAARGTTRRDHAPAETDGGAT